VGNDLRALQEGARGLSVPCACICLAICSIGGLVF
jgi:hypothetical protein